MDFKIFCKQESYHLACLKEYKNLLESFANRDKTQSATLSRTRPVKPKSNFFGIIDQKPKNDFTTIFDNLPPENSYDPYEEDLKISTFCDKCDGKICATHPLIVNSQNRRSQITRRSLPSHLSGKLTEKQKKKLKKKQKKLAKELADESGEVQNTILYKVTVKTSVESGAGTKAGVWIRLVGEKQKSEPIQLKKNVGICKFQFAPASVESFHFRSLDFNEIIGINLKLDKLEGEEWRPEWIKLENLITKQQWNFHINQWLSDTRHGCKLVMKLKAEKVEINFINYQCSVMVSESSVDIFSGQLFIKLSGNNNRKSDQILLKHEKYKKLKKATNYDFLFQNADLGMIGAICVGVTPQSEIQQSSSSDDEIRSRQRSSSFKRTLKREDSVESKKSNTSHGWEDIKIDIIRLKWKDADDQLNELEFVMDGWIGLSHRQKRHSVILKNPKILKGKNKKLGKIESVNYDVTFITGKKMFAGTDANVFFKLYGSLGIGTGTLEFADYDSKRFEKSTEDTIRINAENVGTVNKIMVWHSNTGMASGWNLDKIRIVRHLTSQEICDILMENMRRSKLPEELTCKQGQIYLKSKLDESFDQLNINKLHKIKDSDSDSLSSSSQSLSSASPKFNKAPINKVTPRAVRPPYYQQNSNDSRSKYADSRNRIKLPYGEETTFLCKNWLSVTDGDKSIKRSLESRDIKVLYSPIGLEINPDKSK